MILDLRIMYIAALVIIAVGGGAVTGSAQSMSAIIVGRVINGAGSSGTFQM